MSVVDSVKDGFGDMTWSPDGNWLTYVRNGDEICKTRVTGGGAIAVTKGYSPCFTSDNDIIFERDDEIYIHSGSQDRLLVGKSDIVSETPKRKPKTSLDGKRFIFVIDSVFHKDSELKNAYPYRSFLGVGKAGLKASGKMLPAQQWYGGAITWLPNNDHFLHYEFDSTGGARVHMTNLEGENLGTIFGLMPSISPDEKRIACKPKSGQSVVVYVNKQDEWDMQNVETVVTKLSEGGRISGTPPLWLDNRSVLVDEGGKLYRVDTRKQETVEVKKIPTPALRGTHTMALSPSRERIAVEVETEDGFELHIVSVN